MLNIFFTIISSKLFMFCFPFNIINLLGSCSIIFLKLIFTVFKKLLFSNFVFLFLELHLSIDVSIFISIKKVKFGFIDQFS